MEIMRGKIAGAQKVVIYGPEGIGKSTFAAQFPNPLFIDTEGSTNNMDVARFPKPNSWIMLGEQVRYVKANPSVCDTLVIDTADWAEMLCIEYICSKAPNAKEHGIGGIEGFGYGKGYTYLAEEFGRFLNALEEVKLLGINVVITAHAWMRKFEQPDEIGNYDRWEMKLGKKTAPLIKEWADMVLFANYKTYVVNVDGQGAQKGKNKAQGGQRIMYTEHHSCWDAKNRHGLDSELPFDYKKIAHCIPTKVITTTPVSTTPLINQNPLKVNPPAEIKKDESPINPPVQDSPEKKIENKIVLPRALAELMVKDKVTDKEIQWVVAVKGNGGKGYYPIDTPIANYDPEFVKGALVGMWPQIVQMVIEKRQNDEWEKLRNGEANNIEGKAS